MSVLVLKAGDIELNPGPNKKSHSYFSCCYWNVNSLPTANYCKVEALKAYSSFCKYDFLFVSETSLNSSFESNDKDLMIGDLALIQAVFHVGNHLGMRKSTPKKLKNNFFPR